ncbi:DinB family protein [uncultured Litoreibacter sp.]|uniref:DinB family protein n=1 Tax=uncultured Litoreibacter sp. TaxID=1392394 RepID=UPI00260B0D85|nr:DinB family protein [uncultured Litoreibacter sp.]
MIVDVEYCRIMARYNAWQNKSVARCFKALGLKELQKDRKAFFGSLWGTGNHLLWGDQLWISRFDGGHGPQTGIPDSTSLHDDLQLFLDDRMRTDARIQRWADKLQNLDLTGPMTWYSGAMEREISKPKALCVVHFFNHQTHHRGQIHAMLTAAGQKPDDTDLPFMPE